MIEVIYLGSVFCVILTVYILLIKKDALRSYADYLLSSFFIFQAFAVIIYLLIYSGWIINVPHLYKTAAPFNYLFPVLTYLYVRAVLYNEKSFSKNDLWHFMPFLLFIINYLPFYILPLDQKKLIVIATTKDLNLTYKYQAGIIPEYISFLIRIFQTFIYLIFQWKLIIQYKKENTIKAVQSQIKEVVKWLKIFTWASTFFVIAFIVLTILALLFNTIFITGIMNYLPGMIISISFFVISSYLVTHPVIMEGLPFIKYKAGEKNVLNDQSRKLPFIKENYTAEIEKIDQYFHREQPYLTNNFTIGHLSVEINIPMRELSYIINNYYNMRFTDLLNTYRINHITDKINVNNLKNYTIESLAIESGFSSMPSFYRAFNKMHHCTPTEFLDKLKR